ncbi:hypothetical protein KC19_5G077000 [Ceratodon purpureus]|uniref:Uncharacterized protein n=1 Tax=Ceratodon purpureus TaxID=3225 RepID=A0A8T0I0G3_CERPU|nr:hypothetical protein KC19_5G077000 [Ceratodon purpureus]
MCILGERMATCTKCRCDVFDFNKSGVVHPPEGYHEGLACCQNETNRDMGEEFLGENVKKLVRILRFRVGHRLSVLLM